MNFGVLRSWNWPSADTEGCLYIFRVGHATGQTDVRGNIDKQTTFALSQLHLQKQVKLDEDTLKIRLQVFSHKFFDKVERNNEHNAPGCQSCIPGMPPHH